MATKLSYNIPNGSTLQIAQTMGASLAVSGISNAKEAVATLSAADSSIAAGDYVQLFTSWVNMNGLVCRVKSITSDKVTPKSTRKAAALALWSRSMRGSTCR